MKSSTILVFVIFISFCFASIQSSTFDRNKGLNPKSAPQHIVADTYAQAVEQVSQLLLKSQSTPKVSQRLSLFAARIPANTTGNVTNTSAPTPYPSNWTAAPTPSNWTAAPTPYNGTTPAPTPSNWTTPKPTPSNWTAAPTPYNGTTPAPTPSNWTTPKPTPSNWTAAPTPSNWTTPKPTPSNWTAAPTPYNGTTPAPTPKNSSTPFPTPAPPMPTPPPIPTPICAYQVPWNPWNATLDIPNGGSCSGPSSNIPYYALIPAQFPTSIVVFCTGPCVFRVSTAHNWMNYTGSASCMFPNPMPLELTSGIPADETCSGNQVCVGQIANKFFIGGRNTTQPFWPHGCDCTDQSTCSVPTLQVY